MTAPFLTPAALRRGFQRVRENHGCPGADDVSIAQFEAGLEEESSRLAEAVETGVYWAWPLRRIEIEKSPGSEERRTLLVPAVRDRVLQTAVAAHIEPILEAEFEPCSFAYRRGRSVRMAVERVYHFYTQGYTWVLDADIDAFFDSVPREIPVCRVAALGADELSVRLLRLWLDYTAWDGICRQ